MHCVRIARDASCCPETGKADALAEQRFRPQAGLRVITEKRIERLHRALDLPNRESHGRAPREPRCSARSPPAGSISSSPLAGDTSLAIPYKIDEFGDFGILLT